MTLSISTQLAHGDSLTSFAAMLNSVAFADELIIFNMERSDTPAIKLFKQFKAKVINIVTPVVVEEIRNRQIQEAQSDWVLVMDYDEIIPSDLKDEILTLTDNLAACSAYAIPRNNYSLGFPLRHGGWERDYVVRLIRKADLLDWPKNIHSSPKVRGCTIHANHFMEHHKDESLSQMVDKTNRYSRIEAEQYFEGGLPPVTPLTLLRKWWMETLRRSIFKQGLLDGKIGLIQSLYQGFSVFISYAKLYELQLLSKSTTLTKFPKHQNSDYSNN